MMIIGGKLALALVVSLQSGAQQPAQPQILLPDPVAIILNDWRLEPEIVSRAEAQRRYDKLAVKVAQTGTLTVDEQKLYAALTKALGVMSTNFEPVGFDQRRETQRGVRRALQSNQHP
jgi:hypothetical protein